MTGSSTETSLQTEIPHAGGTPLIIDEKVKGRVMVNEIRSGFQVSGFDLVYKENTCYEIEEEPALFCGVLTSPKPSQLNIEGIGAVDIQTYCPILIAFAESRTCGGMHLAGAKNAGAGCHISPDCLEGLANLYQEETFELLADALRRRTAIRQLPPSGRLLSLVQQMLEHPYEGSLAKMFLEGCMLAFMAELGTIFKSETERRCVTTLGRREYERAEELRRILDTNIIAPPSLKELSNQLAVNTTTMSKQFTAVFGTTIFKYVSLRRLEIAQALLRNGELPISQVGYRVGFNNPGAFATAYRRHFGYAPSDESTQASSLR